MSCPKVHVLELLILLNYYLYLTMLLKPSTLKEKSSYLGEHYGVGDHPIINPENLLTEWVDLRVNVILNCCMKDTI